MNDDQIRRQQFNNEIALYRTPHYQSFEFFLGHSVSYAQLALKWAFLLNGGALIALPTITKQLAAITDPKSAATNFVIGLVLAAVSCVFAYVNFMHLAQSSRSEGIKSEWQITMNYYGSDEGNQQQKETIEKLNSGIKTSALVVNSTLWLSLIAGILSYIGFIVGSYELIS